MKERRSARRRTDAQETTSNPPSSLSSSSSRANRADDNVQQRQESNVGVHEQDADVNNDDKEKQSTAEDKSHVQGEQETKTVIHSHTSFQAATRRSFEALGSCQRW